ncbi:exocyst complex component 3-like protein 4 [Tautogolabrus adspersus]
MDISAENSDEDRVSLKSNGKTPSDGAVKETMGVLKTFRRSIQRAAEKSPLSSGGKGSKSTPKSDAADNEPWSQPPPSPSMSAGSPVTSPVTSPLKSIGALFQKKEEDEGDTTSQKSKGLTRAKTDPNMVRLGDSLMKKGASLRRSLKFNTKKDKDKTSPKELLGQVSEFSVEEKKEEKEEEEEEDEECGEMEETYILPELPHTPLSVMQINKLIENEVLEEAHLNLLALRQEFQQEQERSGEDSPMELAKKEKDLNLLYGELRNKVNTIVRDSNSFPSRNKGLLVPVARIIQEEERRAEKPGGLTDSWMEDWREAVCEGVQVKVEGVHLDPRENVSWLAVHLGLLGKVIVEDLENVRKQLRWSYPPSFKVFSTYVKSYHRVVGKHLKKLEPQVTKLKDLFALLNWIINSYKSERIMGSPSLQPDMKDERADPQLEDDFLKQLKEKYCRRVKEDMRSSLDRLVELENKEVWSVRKTPEREENVLISHVDMDIWTTVKGNAKCSRQIDAQLEQRVISSCLEELKHFPKRFETEFRRHCDALRPQPLWAEYHITYINSFTALQQHMEGYQAACPQEVEGFRKEVKWLFVRLTGDLEDQFKEDVKPYLRRMMTRKWLTNDVDFKELYRQTELLSRHCTLMRPPHAQEFASRLHYHVVREYVGQLMKNNYSCKNRKHEKAARKIREQWVELRDLFDDMKSTHEWLHPVGEELCDIIIQKNKTDIKNHLQPLVEHYPDFSRKHLVAVLYFRGLVRGREHQLILQRLSELKRKAGSGVCDKSRPLFSDMEFTVNTDCFSNLPFSCLSFFLPDN